MASKTQKKKGPGRPPLEMPEPIPDTLENVAWAVLNTPPKKKWEWKFMQEKKSKKERA